MFRRDPAPRGLPHLVQQADNLGIKIAAGYEVRRSLPCGSENTVTPRECPGMLLGKFHVCLCHARSPQQPLGTSGSNLPRRHEVHDRPGLPEKAKDPVCSDFADPSRHERHSLENRTEVGHHESAHRRLFCQRPADTGLSVWRGRVGFQEHVRTAKDETWYSPAPAGVRRMGGPGSS